MACEPVATQATNLPKVFIVLMATAERTTRPVWLSSPSSVVSFAAIRRTGHFSLLGRVLATFSLRFLK